MVFIFFLGRRLQDTATGDVEGMLRSYMGNFVKAEVITAARDVTGVKYMEIHNQKDNDDLTVGVQAMRCLESLAEDSSPMIATRFYQ